jgi:branched-chain amino acid transport system ATP-binding protein
VSPLLGANGAGKITAGDLRLGAHRGEIRRQRAYDGRATEDIVQRGIAHVPDGRGTFFELTVEENLRFGLHPSRPSDRRPRARVRFPVCGSGPSAGRHVSGGEQQMLAIARAPLTARLLLLDEPSFIRRR